MLDRHLLLLLRSNRLQRDPRLGGYDGGGVVADGEVGTPGAAIVQVVRVVADDGAHGPAASAGVLLNTPALEYCTAGCGVRVADEVVHGVGDVGDEIDAVAGNERHRDKVGWIVRLVMWALGCVWDSGMAARRGRLYTLTSGISLAGPETTLARQDASRVSGLRLDTSPDGTQQGVCIPA